MNINEQLKSLGFIETKTGGTQNSELGFKFNPSEHKLLKLLLSRVGEKITWEEVTYKVWGSEVKAWDLKSKIRTIDVYLVNIKPFLRTINIQIGRIKNEGLTVQTVVNNG